MFDFTAFLHFDFSGVHQHCLQPVQFLNAVPDSLDGPHLSAPFASDTLRHRGVVGREINGWTMTETATHTKARERNNNNVFNIIFLSVASYQYCCCRRAVDGVTVTRTCFITVRGRLVDRHFSFPTKITIHRRPSNYFRG